MEKINLYELLKLNIKGILTNTMSIKKPIISNQVISHCIDATLQNGIRNQYERYIKHITTFESLINTGIREDLFQLNLKQFFDNDGNLKNTNQFLDSLMKYLTDKIQHTAYYTTFANDDEDGIILAPIFIQDPLTETNKNESAALIHIFNKILLGEYGTFPMTGINNNAIISFMYVNPLSGRNRYVLIPIIDLYDKSVASFEKNLDVMEYLINILIVQFGATIYRTYANEYKSDESPLYKSFKKHSLYDFHSIRNQIGIIKVMYIMMFLYYEYIQDGEYEIKLKDSDEEIKINPYLLNLISAFHYYNLEYSVGMIQDELFRPGAYKESIPVESITYKGLDLKKHISDDKYCGKEAHWKSESSSTIMSRKLRFSILESFKLFTDNLGIDYSPINTNKPLDYISKLYVKDKNRSIIIQSDVINTVSGFNSVINDIIKDLSNLSYSDNELWMVNTVYMNKEDYYDNFLYKQEI